MLTEMERKILRKYEREEDGESGKEFGRKKSECVRRDRRIEGVDWNKGELERE